MWCVEEEMTHKLRSKNSRTISNRTPSSSKTLAGACTPGLSISTQNFLYTDRSLHKNSTNYVCKFCCFIYFRLSKHDWQKILIGMTWWPSLHDSHIAHWSEMSTPMQYQQSLNSGERRMISSISHGPFRQCHLILEDFWWS